MLHGAEGKDSSDSYYDAIIGQPASAEVYRFP